MSDRHKTPAIKIRAPADRIAAWKQAAVRAGKTFTQWARDTLDAMSQCGTKCNTMKTPLLMVLAALSLVACSASDNLTPSLGQDGSGLALVDSGAPDAGPGLETDSGVPVDPHQPKPTCPTAGGPYFLEQASGTWGMVCVHATDQNDTRFFCCYPPPPGCMCDNSVPIPNCAGSCSPVR